MDSNDILTLRNCIAFVLDNDTDLVKEDITELHRINNNLLQQLEAIL